VAGLPLDFLTLIFIKQVFNGLLNALVAEGLMRLPAIASRIPSHDSILSATLKQYVFSRVLFVVMIPALALAILYTRTAYQGEIHDVRSRVERTAQEVRVALKEALRERESALDILSHRIEAGFAPTSRSAELLGAFLREHPEFVAVALADEQGNVLAAQPADRPGFPPSLAGEGCFQEVRQREQRSRSTAVQSSTGAAPPALLVCQPVVGGSEPFRATLVARLDSAPLEAIVERPPRRGPEVATLLDDDQRVIASLDAGLRPGASFAGFLPAQVLSGQDPESFTYAPPVLGGAATAVELRRRYAAYRRVATTGWGVLVDVPATSLYAGLRGSAWRILALLLVNLATLYAVVARFARKVSEPLLAVNEAANDIAAGHFPSPASLQELAHNPIGEIQSVALHFMSMRDALAYRDALTGLPNRRLFLDRLGLAVSKSRRVREGLAVLYVDLDRFRIIDDSLGHAVGNLLLRTVAERLQACMREGDTVARLGADEFVVLVRTVDQQEDAARVARKVLEVLRAPFKVAERELFVTGSIGISLFPSDGTAAEPILNNAHTAMHQAKAEGRDTYRLYAPAMNDSALEQLSLESGLRKALANDEFEVYYQPVLNLRTFRPEGAEALVRWQHPERGLLAAAQFISLAESSGLIVAMDSWVLRTACARTRLWHRAGHTELRVAVNLSARQFQQPDLVEEVTRCLRDTGLPASALEIEITERIAMLDVARAVEVLRALRTLGVRISLDDFGTGYSSLSYLKTLPVDTVKLDQSFVRNITTDTGDAAIATAVIAMAHSLSLKVVAEGVETPEQLAFLRERGCDLAQGNLVGVAMPAERLEVLFERRLDSLLVMGD
jgi:diguanylate cyclase (GGDEF)-like protein